MITLFLLLMFAFAVLEIITGVIADEFWFLLVAFILYGILMVFLHRNLRKSYQKRNLEKIDYIFGESSFQIKAASDIVSGENTLAYRGIRKAYETKTALYLLTDGGIYIVSFNGFSSLDEEAVVKETIKSALGKKYIRCR